MNYERGTLNKLVYYNKLDGRNKAYPEFTHRLTVRSRLEDLNVRAVFNDMGYAWGDIKTIGLFNGAKWRLKKNIELNDFDKTILQSPIVLDRETRHKFHYYMRDDLLTMFVIMYGNGNADGFWK